MNIFVYFLLGRFASGPSIFEHLGWIRRETKIDLMMSASDAPEEKTLIRIPTKFIVSLLYFARTS